MMKKLESVLGALYVFCACILQLLIVECPAVLPLAKILVTALCRSSKTGPRFVEF